MITLTDSAQKRIQELENQNNKWVRLVVDSGGCSGFEYKFQFTDSPNDDETNINGLLCDEVTLNILGESTVDFVENVQGAYFKVDIPHASSSCGCGSSFNL